MMTHLTDAQLATLTTTGGQDPHLAGCQHCQQRLTGWQNMAAGIRLADTRMTGPLTVPGFDELLGDALPASRAAASQVTAPVEVVSPRVGASWWLVWALVARQLRLAPRIVLPLSALGFLTAVLLALTTVQSGMERFFTAAVVLVILIGTLAVCGGRADPRLELLFSTPISPSVVFTCRLVLVLSVDLALALVASLVVSQVGATGDLLGVVTGWLGPTLLACAVGVVCTVWRSRLVGGFVGGVVWLLGTASTVPNGVLTGWLASVLSQVWATTPWTLIAAAGLLILAVRGMRVPRLSTEPA